MLRTSLTGIAVHTACFMEVIKINYDIAYLKTPNKRSNVYNLYYFFSQVKRLHY